MVALLAAVVWIAGMNSFERDPGAGSDLNTFGAPVENPLIARHHCWTGEAPAGAIPGHVVAMVAGGRTVYGGPALVARALGGDPAVSALGFCK